MPHGNVTGVSKVEAKLLDVHLVANQQALLEKKNNVTFATSDLNSLDMELNATEQL